ncbi:cytochrome C [Pollutimonas subterranea]|uniref:Cytochrome C n=1 Tax=Pollutimonas subterranea TaxID=2045210 RepID=A0A2N4U9Z0_9BURK|nr:c-type cytochrome [Pollutimonas subterranea]PLC51831.1 cytochrome C [Pollutimonas subterranea]
MRTWKRVAGITLATSAVAAAVLGGIVVYTGVYDVSATSQHTAVVYHLLETSLRRSVKLRTSELNVPDLNSADRAVNGFKDFDAHCVQCHGAPGIAPQPFALGLTPVPASLVDTARVWSAAEIYWVIRHGIKMSGMPAWRYRMTDQQIWDVVAFVKVLPTLSPADYKDWISQHGSVPKQAEIQTPRISATSTAPDAQLGDAAAGQKALQQYLCVACHAIPGVVGANHHVGPPLAGIASRQYIAGVLPNTPANMLRWLRNPTDVDPLSAMPDLDVSEQDARDIAAFLYTLNDTE